MYLHDVKFSADIFLFLTRSSMAISGIAFDVLSKSRFEYEYGQSAGVVEAPTSSKGGVWPFKR
jgi:hypothetical protein